MTDTQVVAIGKLYEAYRLLNGCIDGLVWCNDASAMERAHKTQKKAEELFEQGIALLGDGSKVTRNPIEAGYFPSRAHWQCGDES